jgi:hypothetical protein
VKKGKVKGEKLVNAYVCSNNAAQYELAEDLEKELQSTDGSGSGHRCAVFRAVKMTRKQALQLQKIGKASFAE